MAEPKVFVSSTCYDLRYIRENLKYFIKSLGYDPILSEEGSVFFNPKLHVQDACIAELPNCQMLVLIIGGRFGSSFKGTPKSVTNAEYSEAARLKIPIFALVEQGVHSDLNVYASNRSDERLVARMKFPSVDSTAVFDFIEEVRSNAVNNALVPFRDFADIESYLRQQWAGMMFSFLAGANQNARVTDTLSVMQEMSERIEMLSRQILNSVGTDQAKVTAALYDAMMAHEMTDRLREWGWRITPISVLRNETFVEFAKALSGTRRKRVVIWDEKTGFVPLGAPLSERLTASISPDLGRSRLGKLLSATYDVGEIRIHVVSPGILDELSKGYAKMHNQLQRIVKRFGLSVEDFLASEATVNAVPPSQKRSSRSR